MVYLPIRYRMVMCPREFPKQYDEAFTRLDGALISKSDSGSQVLSRPAGADISLKTDIFFLDKPAKCGDYGNNPPVLEEAHNLHIQWIVYEMCVCMFHAITSTPNSLPKI